MQKIEIKDKKTLLIAVGVLILLGLLVAYLVASRTDDQGNADDWTLSKPQNVESIKDPRLATPIVTDAYTIDYVGESDTFIVIYPGYYQEDNIEVMVVSFFKQFENMDSIKIKYGSVSSETKTYDMKKDITEILANNPSINPPDIDKEEFGTSP